MKYIFTNYKLLIDKYLEKKINLSPGTVSLKKIILNHFGKFINFKTEFNETDLENYLNSDYFLSLKQNTKDTNKLTLRDFFSWLGFSRLPVLKSSFMGTRNSTKKEEPNEQTEAFNLLRDNYVAEKLINLSRTSVITRRTAINSFGEFVNFKTDFSRDDLIKYLNSDQFTKLKVGSRNSYKLSLKGFLSFCGIDATDLLKKSRVKETVLQPTDLITKEELRTLLKKLDKPLHKAILMLLFESKARKMEILNLKVKDIVFYDSYAIVNVRKSKTLARPIPIVESIPFITRYLEDHPFVEFKNGKIMCENPDVYLFGHYHDGKFTKYSKNYVNTFLDTLFEREKNIVGNKRIYPHLFRHTGLTELAKANVNESVIRKIGGYTDDSTMIKRYVHLANDDVEKAILGLYGIVKPKNENDSFKTIETIKCPRCDYENSDLDKFCSRCGSVLDIKTALEHQEKAAELEQLVEKSDLKKYIDQLFEEKLKDIVKN